MGKQVYIGLELWKCWLIPRLVIKQQGTLQYFLPRFCINHLCLVLFSLCPLKGCSSKEQINVCVLMSLLRMRSTQEGDIETECCRLCSNTYLNSTECAVLKGGWISHWKPHFIWLCEHWSKTCLWSHVEQVCIQEMERLSPKLIWPLSFNAHGGISHHASTAGRVIPVCR